MSLVNNNKTLYLKYCFVVYSNKFISGGKQWQTTPKNLLRMQCARAIPVT